MKDPKVTEYLDKLVEYTWDVALKYKWKALQFAALAQAGDWPQPVPLQAYLPQAAQ